MLNPSVYVDILVCDALSPGDNARDSRWILVHLRLSSPRIAATAMYNAFAFGPSCVDRADGGEIAGRPRSGSAGVGTSRVRGTREEPVDEREVDVLPVARERQALVEFAEACR